MGKPVRLYCETKLLIPKKSVKNPYRIKKRFFTVLVNA